MSDADLLRRAAAKVREAAEGATPGPWRVTKGYSGNNWIDANQYDEVLAPAPVECMAYCYGGSSRIELTDPDAAYIATMHPLVGLALADWLENEAECMDVLEPCSESGLALARVILGEDT